MDHRLLTSITLPRIHRDVPYPYSVCPTNEHYLESSSLFKYPNLETPFINRL